MNGQFPLGDINPITYFVVVAMGLGLLFALITPDSEQPFWHIAIQWQLQACLSVVLLIGGHLLLARFNGFRKITAWLRLLISGFVGSILFTPIALLIDFYWVGDQLETTLLMEIIDEWSGVAAPLIAAWLAMNACWLMGMQYTRVGRVQNTPEASGQHRAERKSHPGSELLRLANLADYSQIICLSADIHYLAVYTANSHQLVLFSLRDAVADMPADRGIQIHRSHWIAWQAVVDINKKGRQGTAIMSNGLELPISRANLAHVLQQWQQFRAKFS